MLSTIVITEKIATILSATFASLTNSFDVTLRKFPKGNTCTKANVRKRTTRPTKESKKKALVAIDFEQLSGFLLLNCVVSPIPSPRLDSEIQVAKLLAAARIPNLSDPSAGNTRAKVRTCVREVPILSTNPNRTARSSRVVRMSCLARRLTMVAFTRLAILLSTCGMNFWSAFSNASSRLAARFYFLESAETREGGFGPESVNLLA